MKNAVTRWNIVYNNMGSLSDVVWVGVNDIADVVAVEDDPTGQYLGQTYIDGSSSPDCFIHSTSGNPTFAATIFITPQPWWFTQDDTRRAYWEDTCPAQNPPTYTCTKLYDFGGTFAHELGHAAGFVAHPTDVDAHTFSGSLNYAECLRTDDNDGDPTTGKPLWRATMCGTLFQGNGLPYPNQKWRSERRTLENYDRESLDAIHDRF